MTKKISLCYQAAEKCLDCLLDALRALNLDDKSKDIQDDVWWIKNHAERTRDILTAFSSDIRELERFLPEDEQAIIDIVCEVEKMITGEIKLVKVHPEPKNPVTGMDFELAKRMTGYHDR